MAQVCLNEARYLVATDQKVRVGSLPLAECAELSHAIVRFAARKFTPEGGKVVVNVQTGQAGVLLSVHDQGIGIALEHQEKIFESFFQVEGGSTRRAGGTGLGLSITKKLTELHGGRIWVESELGKGSSFFVELPWQTQAT